MFWLLAALGLLNLVVNYAIWVVLCDLANQDRAAREWDEAASVFANHLKES